LALWLLTRHLNNKELNCIELVVVVVVVAVAVAPAAAAIVLLYLYLMELLM
jgi:hypothetical protein